MRIEQDHLGQIKNYVYIGSAAVLFLTWCLSLAALTQTGGVDGRLAWVFGLVSARPRRYPQLTTDNAIVLPHDSAHSLPVSHATLVAHSSLLESACARSC